MVSLPPFRELLPLGSVFVATAILDNVSAQPWAWVCCGLAIIGSSLAGAWVSRVVWIARRRRAKTNHTLHPPASKNTHRSRRSVSKFLILLIYVMSMMDVGFTQKEANIVGPEMEANLVAVPFLRSGPIGLVAYRFVTAAFGCQLLLRFAGIRSVRLVIVALVVTYAAVMLYWAMWYSLYFQPFGK